MDAFKAWVCSSECKIPAGAGWDDLNVKLAEAAWLAAIASERERCAAIAWSHYMNTCLKANLAPSMWQKWCASDAIRRA